MKIFILILAIAMYALIIAFPQRKSWIALGCAAIILGLSLLFPGPGSLTLARAFLGHVNWNILLIYAGSLVIAELFIYSRIPAVLADIAVEKSPTLGIAIVIILSMTGFISAFVENVATVLLMAPIALEVSRRLKVDPTPFMIGLAVMANLQGTATLVGDPPSMIFASYAGYSFNDFFFYDGKPSIFFAVQAGALAGGLFFFAYFRKFRKADFDLPKEKILSFVPSILLAAMIAGLALVSFLSGGGMHYSSGILCALLAVAGLAWLFLWRKEPAAKVKALLKGLDWDTIAFLVGIFIVLGAMGDAGLIHDLAKLLGRAIGEKALLGYIVIVSGSVLLSGFIDNVPYIIAMLPVAAELTMGMGLKPEFYMFALLIGSCLGGNLTPFGASANVVAVGILRKEGYKTNFGRWVRIGLPFTLLTTAVGSLFIFLVWG